MPLAEYDGWTSWGYGNSHYLAIEYAGGGRDQFKYFIRACHRYGIAVIMDVVYNHYTPNAERAQWAYDSNAPERNIYYWYEGLVSDYPALIRPAAAATSTTCQLAGRRVSGRRRSANSSSAVPPC